MLSSLLIILGSVLMLITIMMATLFLIVGMKKRLEDIKELVTSGIVGLLMIVLGALPWDIAVIVGMIALAVGGLAFFSFILLPSYRKGKFREMPNLRKYTGEEYIKPVLRFLIRMGAVTAAVLLFDFMGLSIFLIFRGYWNLLNFTELLTILLLLEGSLVGAAGGFMFVGYSEYGLARQGAINPAIARDQRDRWKERRSSQQKWGVAMLIAGVLLILLGLSVSFLTSL